MKVEKKPIQREIEYKTVYIAYDDTEFDNKMDCYAYEDRKKTEGIFPLRIIHAEPVSEYDYADFNWYYIEDKNDITILEKYLGIELDNIKINFPDWVGIETSYESFDKYYVYSTLERYKKNFNEFLSNFEK